MLSGGPFLLPVNSEVEWLHSLMIFSHSGQRVNLLIPSNASVPPITAPGIIPEIAPPGPPAIPYPAPISPLPAAPAAVATALAMG